MGGHSKEEIQSDFQKCHGKLIAISVSTLSPSSICPRSLSLYLSLTFYSFMAFEKEHSEETMLKTPRIFYLRITNTCMCFLFYVKTYFAADVFNM